MFAVSQKSKVLMGGALVGAAALMVAQQRSRVARADGDVLHAPEYPWNHKKPWQSFDYASVRRGHMVFTEVCSTCHSVERLAFRNLVDTCYTEAEVKELAADVDVIDGPDDTGEMFERPGKLADYIPGPYRNEAEARFSNNGAYPPDLSLIIKARHGGPDYLFALLTGYRRPPDGVTVAPGMHYNPYFPGGQIAMAQALSDDLVDYDDGTPQTASQYAKDVTTFLAWASEPEADQRKRMGMKFMIICALTAVPVLYYKRFKWNVLKSRKITFTK